MEGVRIKQQMVAAPSVGLLSSSPVQAGENGCPPSAPARSLGSRHEGWKKAFLPACIFS